MNGHTIVYHVCYMTLLPLSTGLDLPSVHVLQVVYVSHHVGPYGSLAHTSCDPV